MGFARPNRQPMRDGCARLRAISFACVACGENSKIRGSSLRVSINRDQNGSGPVHWPTVFAMVAKWRAIRNKTTNSFIIEIAM
jgi:hypothetical protein